MKLSKITLMAGTLAVAGFAAAQGPGFHPGGFGPGFGGSGFGHEVVASAPYSATITSTSTETLQDGTIVTHTGTRTIARDSQGRVREDITLQPRPAHDNHPAPTTESSIFDPVAKTITHWSDASKTAHQMSFGNRPADGKGHPEHTPKENPNVATTDLGSKTINGISVTGKRITRTIPAGKMGNDKAIVITHETWFSPDLKIVISETDSDPFRGTHTTTVSVNGRTEPAATLFTTPAGYTVEQGHPGGPRGHRGPEGVPPPPAPGE